MEIILLTDYKGHLDTKWGSKPYRSGLDKKKLKKIFGENEIEIEFRKFADVQYLHEIEDKIILYTSSDDIGYYYKSYIEDVVHFLTLQGANVIPRFEFLRANNNKLFMELLRSRFDWDYIKTLKSWVFGTFEELKEHENEFDYPIVVKEPQGAMSKGVYLAENKKELYKISKNVSNTRHIMEDVKDILRSFRHSNYKRESTNRKKFIVQQFVPGLQMDYKILIFGKKYFIFERPTREGDFRASGSGSKHYIYGSEVNYPAGIFNFAKKIFGEMDVPYLSLDILYDGERFHIVEFQAIHFGTVGVVKSDGFYKEKNKKWEFMKHDLSVEKVYVESICDFIR